MFILFLNFSNDKNAVKKRNRENRGYEHSQTTPYTWNSSVCGRIQLNRKQEGEAPNKSQMETYFIQLTHVQMNVCASGLYIRWQKSQILKKDNSIFLEKFFLLEKRLSNKFSIFFMQTSCFNSVLSFVDSKSPIPKCQIKPKD